MADNFSQTRVNEPAVTILDYRRGFITTHLPPVGKHQMAVWAGTRMERKLNLGQTSLPHCGVYSNQSIQNYMISGASSYMPTRKDKKAPWSTLIHCDSLCDWGLVFGADVINAAILFSQPNGRPQAMQWVTGPGTASRLIVPPATGDFTFSGGHIDLSGKSARRVTGLSATPTNANNLRGINVEVKEGARDLSVAFPNPEADAAYAVSVTPTWMTNLCVSAKKAEGFTVQFSAPAPLGAKVDWIMVR